MTDAVALQNSAETEFLAHLHRRFLGSWRVEAGGAQVHAITAGNQGLSFTVVGSEEDVWQVPGDWVIGAEPRTLHRWWAFVMILDGLYSSAVFLLPEVAAKRVVLTAASKVLAAKGLVAPALQPGGRIEVPLFDLLPMAKGFDDLPA
ncbi:hypothetical protein PU560_09625 [Georgenia sp. 10Sc9-8]|uniref:DUF2750 domain-containing protein n=1 Tax=Georgenia halotolerans TaxID=3028317 RepID=A0ABT5TXD0_9MICO|nr:hypothetical protein [Georgenia halotolerans]